MSQNLFWFWTIFYQFLLLHLAPPCSSLLRSRSGAAPFLLLKFMVRGAKEELLRSNTQKVTKLEGKKRGAAPEQLRSGSGAAPERLRSGSGAAPEWLRSSSGAERSREEQGGAEEIDKKLSKTKTNSETHF